MDAAFGQGLLIKLNALKNTDFVTLLVSSHRSVNHAIFRGTSSPLTLDEIKLNDLNYETIGAEIKRCLPDFPDNHRTYLQEQLETEPNRTYQLLLNLLNALESMPEADMRDLKRILIEKKRDMGEQTRK
jgi:hypothetical protein